MSKKRIPRQMWVIVDEDYPELVTTAAPDPYHPDLDKEEKAYLYISASLLRKLRERWLNFAAETTSPAASTTWMLAAQQLEAAMQKRDDGE